MNRIIKHNERLKDIYSENNLFYDSWSIKPGEYYWKNE